MPTLPTPVLPKRIPHGPHKPSSAIQVSPLLLEAAGSEPEEVLQKLHTSKDGLSGDRGRAAFTTIRPQRRGAGRTPPAHPLAGQSPDQPPRDPVARARRLPRSSPATYRAGSVMLLMVILGVVLRFVQEARADSAAAKLRAMISVHATVLRDGQPQEVPIGHLVPGDVVQLAAGDMIPADVRLISCKDLFLIQASLTGEVVPRREICRPGRRCGPIAPGIDQRLLPGHQRRERRRHGGRRGHRPDNLPRRHVQRHRGPARRRPASTEA